MSIGEAISLGLIQGLTEFIPISSSGHLVVAQHFFSGASDHLFLEFINLGTLLALLVFFRHRIINILRDIFINKRYRLALNIIVTAIPAGLVGVVFANFIESASFFGSIVTVIVTMSLVGVVMVVLERLPKASTVENSEKLSIGRALTIGLVQVLALIPGVSRSGSTIIAGRLAGLSASEAAEYSFLVSIPIMFGVCLKTFAFNADYFAANWLTLSISNMVAFVSGLFAVGFLMRYLSHHGLAIFCWYRIILASIVTILLLTTLL